MDFGQAVVFDGDRDEVEWESDIDLRSVNQAAAAGHTDKLIQAIQVDPSILEQQDVDGLTPLGHSILGRQLGAVKKLVKMGSNVNAQDKLGRTAVAIAAYQGWYEGVVYLLRHGAKFSLCDKSGRSPLHASCYDPDYRTLCALLHNLSKGEINQKDHEGMTALHWAAFHDRPNHVRILLERGADIFREDIDGKTALHWAAQNGNLQCCELLYKWKDGTSLLNHGDHAGKTPVHFAAAAGNLSVIQSFATVEDCDLEAEDPDDRTPLHWAVATGQVHCVALLLDFGVTPNPVDTEACTPLDYARQSNQKECIKLLEDKLGIEYCVSSSDQQQLSPPTSPISPSHSTTKNPLTFFKGLFGLSSKKRLGYSSSLSSVPSSDVPSSDTTMMKQAMTSQNIHLEGPTEDEVERAYSEPREVTVKENLLDRCLDSKISETSDMRQRPSNESNEDSLVDLRPSHFQATLPNTESNMMNSRVGQLESPSRFVQNGHMDSPRLSHVKACGQKGDKPAHISCSQSLGEPAPQWLIGPGVDSSHSPTPRPLTDPKELGPLKGPKPRSGQFKYNIPPLKGTTMHEKVLALRMDKTGPSRSPTPPSWVDRSFDPLSLRQSHERSPLVTGMIPKNLHQHQPLTPRGHLKKGPGILRSNNLSEQRLHSPAPSVCHSPAPSVSHSPAPSGSQDRTEEFVQLSPDLGSQVPVQSLTSQSPRPRAHNIKPTAGTFSVAERKQLDKQLHNLLL
ncbi:ankyrin-3-like [Liolophura sinensis]|uniref:ankyrin-3-like n=1 Tax=Liolophura sinensis TaxID=3198878 RepID=UPI0031582538